MKQIVYEPSINVSQVFFYINAALLELVCVKEKYNNSKVEEFLLNLSAQVILL